MLEDIFSRDVPVYVSTLTELELFSYPAMTDEEADRIETFLSAVRILPVLSSIARIAGDLRRLYPTLKGFDREAAAPSKPLQRHATPF